MRPPGRAPDRVRVEVRAAGQFTRQAEAEALADGFTRLVALRLGDRDRRSADPMLCGNGSATVAIAVTDAAGLVDLKRRLPRPARNGCCAVSAPPPSGLRRSPPPSSTSGTRTTF